MNRIVAIILAIVLSVVSATAGIRHYCDTTPAIPGLTIQGTPDYSTSYSYDLNGNPTQIYRKGIAHKYTSGSNRQWQYDEIDNLYIDYRGNQVNFTDDSCPWGYYEDAPGYIEESYEDNEYTWDANGNMTKDLNRGITSIQYNLQNQPTRIVYNDRHYEGRIYNSAGQKLRTVHTVLVTSATSSSTSTTTLVIENKRDYYGEDLVYRNDTLEMVLTDVGYVDASGNYHYYVLDYQGNVRQVADAQGNVIEQNDYYPYGGLFGESASRQSYKYSGKELERMNGLNTYDFHARPYYYPVLQFHSPDILGETYYHVSPYLYCLGNPIKYTDPTGMFIISYNYMLLAIYLEYFVPNKESRTVGYAMKYPINAYKVGSYKRNRSNISSTATNFAVNISNVLGFQKESGTPNNAIRHTLWQSIITRELGSEHAERIGNAHEDNPQIDTSIRVINGPATKEKGEIADTIVDLLNNKIGREIGENNKGATNNELAIKVLEVFLNDGLWTYKIDSSGNYIIMQTKITQDEYEKGVEEINRKGQNGLAK